MISDPSGNLLLYSSNYAPSPLNNSSHTLVPNGVGTGGQGHIYAHTFFVKQPGNSNIYYLFNYLSGISKYSVIDKNLASGQGSVTIKNALLNSNIDMARAAVNHCNGVDVWIVGYSPSNSTFYSYLLTSSGVIGPTLSVVSSVLSGVNMDIKFSPNGKKLGVADYGGNNVFMFDFDASTGIVSNLLPLVSFPTDYSVRWCEFSPNSSKFYVQGQTPSLILPLGKILQFDLCAGNNSLIAQSQYTISNNYFGNIQLGIDGKIYVAGGTLGIPGTWLGIINNPDLAGAACNYVNQGVNFAPSQAAPFFLPRFVSSYFNPKPSNPPFTYTLSYNQNCKAVAFTSLSTPSLTGCQVTTYSILGMQWNFGDPASGSSNTSSLTSPVHIYSNAGSYTPQVVYYYSCGKSNDTIRQTITISSPTISVSTTSINCANLGSGTVTAGATVGPYTYSWAPIVQSGSVATGLVPGNHTISVWDQSLSCGSNYSVYFAPLVPLTGSISASQSITCNAANTGTGQVSALAGGSGSQTYFWNNGLQTSAVSSPTNLSAGSWTITVTDALTACQINSVFTIGQPSPLALNLSANTSSACVGNSIALIGINSGGTPGYTYTWTNAPSSASIIVSETIAGTYVYSCSSRDANNCLSSITIALDFIALPVISVSDVSVCPLKFGTLTASGATSYTWNAASPGSTFTDAPLSNTQYTVVGEANTCTSMATASIILYPSPVPTVLTNSPRCEGTSVFINASGGNAYQLTGPAGFNSFLPNNTVSNLALGHAGVYNVIVTSVNNCTAAASATVVVDPTPTISAAGSTVCTTQTMSLFANSIPGTSFVWTGPMIFNSFQQNPTVPNPVLARTGTYTVNVTSMPGCTNSAVAHVSVTTPPSLSLSLSSNSLCYQAFNGSPNTITLSTNGANTYILFTPNLIGFSVPTGTSTTLNVNPPFSTSVTIGTATIVGSNGICTSVGTKVFSVIPNPTVGVNSFTPVICAGQHYTYTSNGADSYVWTATTPNYTTYSNGGVAVTHPSVNSVFSVYGSSLGCNSALQTSSITVNPIPTLTLSAASKSICLHESAQLSVAGTGTSFTWMPAIGLSNTSSSVVTASPLTSQNYTVLVSATNCTNFANLYLNVLPLPTPIIQSSTPSVCLNGRISLIGGGGVFYDWRGPDHLFFQGQEQNVTALNSSYAGNYTLTVTDINGCKASTVTSVEILPLPNGYLKDFDEEVCVPYCNTFNFIAADKKQKLKSSWMINDKPLNGNTFSHCFNTAATYNITGSFTDETTNCKNTTSYLLNVRPKPNADFIFSPKQPIEGVDEVMFTNNSSGDESLSYSWYFNDNKGFSTEHKNTTYLYNEPGEYKVVLVTKNNWTCADTIMKIVKVESDFAMYVPNAFTPNGDERNDVFLPVVRSVKKYDLKIFDRWGKMIFQTTDPNQGWDGTYNGVICKQDVYIWKIHVVSLDGKEKFETGNVTCLPSE